MKKRLTIRILFAAAILLPSVAAKADSWIFQPSYYSHDPVTSVRIGRPSTTGGPYYTRPQGDYVRVGHRYSNTSITVGNMGTDSTNYYDTWIQFGSQY